ncbi:MAG: LysE family translocator [Leptolyngbya sp. SIO4C1]|nr:LysE family translocator [Leptolyngbya sp. SIO4C1]
MTISSITALFGTMLILAIAPGPSDFAVVARSIAAGFTQALIMVSGIIAADFLFILLAVYSLTEVADSFGSLFIVVKYLCSAYLIWLGIGSLRSQPAPVDIPEAQRTSGYSSFLGGLLITLGDPKAILFYMGLFPAFIDLSSIAITDVALIMLIAAATVGGVKASYAYLARRAKLVFGNPRLRRKLDITASSVLIGTGLFLILRG